MHGVLEHVASWYEEGSLVICLSPIGLPSQACLQDMLRQRDMPRALRDRVLDFMSAKYANRRVNHDEEVLAELPAPIRAQVGWGLPAVLVAWHGGPCGASGGARALAHERSTLDHHVLGCMTQRRLLRCGQRFELPASVVHALPAGRRLCLHFRPATCLPACLAPCAVRWRSCRAATSCLSCRCLPTTQCF